MNTHQVSEDKTQTEDGGVKPIVFLKGKHITLRPMLKSDIPTLLRWINDPHTREFVRNQFPMMESSEEQWFDSLGKSREKQVVLAIEVGGKHVGTIGAHGIHPIDRTCSIGIMIGDISHREQGIGTEATMTLLEYLFNTLNMRKIVWEAYGFNKRSCNCAMRCGFKLEGVRRKHIFARGRFHDLILHGMFKEEWLPHWKAFRSGKRLTRSRHK